MRKMAISLLIWYFEVPNSSIVQQALNLNIINFVKVELSCEIDIHRSIEDKELFVSFNIDKVEDFNFVGVCHGYTTLDVYQWDLNRTDLVCRDLAPQH